MTDRRWRFGGPGAVGSLPILILASLAFALIAARLPAPPGMALWNLDLPKIDVPLAVFFHDALARGALPLWEDRLGLGFPLYAEGQIGAFYPPNWLIYRLDPLTALDVTRLVHLAFAGVGTGLLALRLAGNRTGAVLAAAVAILGGAIVTKLQWTNLVAAYAWLPWILLPLARRPAPTRAGLVAAGLLFGVQALAGHPNTWLLTGLAAAVLLLATGRDRRALGRVAVFGVIGGAVGAVQLLPTLLLTTLSVRQAGLSPNDVFTSSATVFDPLAFGFGQPFVGTDDEGWDFFTAWYPDGIFALLEVSAFVGLAVLALAAVGARTRRARPWLAVAIVLLAIPIVAALRPEPWLHVPILNGLRSPVRAYVIIAWVLGLLAAIGVGRIGRGDRGATLAGVAALAVAGWYTAVTAAAVLLPDAFAALYRSAANDGSPEAVARAREMAVATLTAPLPVVAEMAVAVATIGLVGTAVRRPARGPAIRLALVGLAIAPLALLSPLANPLRPEAEAWPVDSELAVALRARDPNRVLTLDAPGFYAGAPDRLAAADVPDLDMFSSLNLATTDVVTERARRGPDAELVRRLVGVDTLVTFGTPCPGADPQALEADAAVVCGIPARTEPYWIPATAIVAVTDPRGILAPHDAELDLAAADAAAVDGVVEHAEPGALTATIRAPADGSVWLGQAWWSAWRVEVDGVPAEAARALGGLFVPVTAGEHRITARLVPLDALAGLAFGVVVGLAAIAWAASPRISPWARRRS